MHRFSVLLGIAASGVALTGMVTVGARTGGSDDTPWVPPGIPTEAEARSALTERWAALQANPTPEAYCGDNAFCPHRWNVMGGAAAVPKQPPHVLSTWTDHDERVLVLCGRDGLGQGYRTDFPVRYDLADRTELDAWLIVFWDNTIYEGYREDNGEPYTAVAPTKPWTPPSNPPECG